MSDFLTAPDVEHFTGADTALTDGQVAGAHATVRRYCNWHVLPLRTETLVTDGECGQYLGLKSLNVVDCTEVRVDGVADTTIDWWSNGRLRRTAGFTDTPRLVEADVEHGYRTVEVPDVMAVVAALSARITAATGNADTEPNVVEEAIGSYRVRLGNTASDVALTESEMLMLAPYRIVEP